MVNGAAEDHFAPGDPAGNADTGWKRLLTHRAILARKLLSLVLAGLDPDVGQCWRSAPPA